MNILQQKSSQEPQETICKAHNLELIAIDLDMSDKSQIKFFCGKCLVDKLNNNKVTTIEQSKERIQQIKTQQKEIETKENQARLSYYKNILDQIMDFKRFMDDSLEKIHKQIQQYMFPIQKEKLELQEKQYQLNYFEDIKQLSELYSNNQQKSNNLIEDNHFVDELTKQFELLFNNAEYFQTLDTFKNTKQIIKDLMENNIIELPPLLQTKNEYKTPSLNRICVNHKKEIIMIDMDSQSKKIEDRFVCVDCISENPQIKYQTIENINKQWIDYNSESYNILQQYKKESKNKRCDLFTQISQMRKNYNQKLNEISDKVISEQFQSINKIKYQNQIKGVSIQSLEDEQLLQDLKQLIEKEKVTQNQTITSFKNKEIIFQKEMENHLESLKYDQLDIQQSIDIIKETPIERNLILQISELITQLSKCTQTKDQNYQNQIEFIKELQEFIDQAKKYQCQINLFDQTITLVQQHSNKIDQIQQLIQNQTNNQVNKQESIQILYQNLSKVLNDYNINFDNKCKQMKKYSNFQQLELDLVKFRELNKDLEIEETNLLNQMSKQLDEKHQEYQKLLKEQQDQNQRKIDEINASKVKENSLYKEQFDQKTQEIINLKKQNEEDRLKAIKTIEDQKNKEITEMNKRINQKESELQAVQKQLDQINQEKLQKEKQQKLELEKIQEYNKRLSFSNTYKSSICQISEFGKVVESSSINNYCLCEQAIPKIGKTMFAFQMLSGTSIRIGIGFRDIIQKNNYQNCGFGFGSYLIRQDGYTFSHHNKDVDNKQLSFTFTSNDIIIMEVSIEHKYIKWTKQNNPFLILQQQIDTSISQELYPCVNIYQSKLKIFDNIPNLQLK
ncbi:unnamed protein product [Paramecium pentaurelia]|uniref:TLDc domain-containing protein n=1 Tax=Paramecium pentaurelia TaxID=43138 RepID=A0A8S1VGS6_9CILI|nr:unnamed protein product [Paramecium pentaurelia]